MGSGDYFQLSSIIAKQPLEYINKREQGRTTQELYGRVFTCTIMYIKGIQYGYSRKRGIGTAQ